jgi:hypothetical protein
MNPMYITFFELGETAFQNCQQAEVDFPISIYNNPSAYIHCILKNFCEASFHMNSKTKLSHMSDTCFCK